MGKHCFQPFERNEEVAPIERHEGNRGGGPRVEVFVFVGQGRFGVEDENEGGL